MKKTTHEIIFEAAENIGNQPAESVELIVTSPPYPMIEMWDEIFFLQNKKIKTAFHDGEYLTAYEMMHEILDNIWKACLHVLKPGGIACINIGDATRTLDKNFQLFPNHSRIVQSCLKLGFQNLPNIIWRKQTNAPNKFMGSGMLPPGAYVTLEHEYVLVFRKGGKRNFKREKEKDNRRRSAYFWEERNQWFSDLWEIKGTRQNILDKKTRERSAAYPFEIPYRLINMFSVMGDTVLDPFIGTGTTSLAALASCRNSVGYEIDPNIRDTLFSVFENKEEKLNQVISKRLENHLLFVRDRRGKKGNDSVKYKNTHHDIPVMTQQEQNIQFPFLKKINISRNKVVGVYE